MEQQTKKIAIAAIIVFIVALVSMNFEQLTGKAITDPISLTISQEGKKITVQLNYAAGKYGQPGKIVDMKSSIGTKLYDSTTKCDSSGPVSRGTSRCEREIAEFDISGQTWSAGDRVEFSVRGMDLKKQYIIK